MEGDCSLRLRKIGSCIKVISGLDIAKMSTGIPSSLSRSLPQSATINVPSLPNYFFKCQKDKIFFKSVTLSDLKCREKTVTVSVDL